MKTRTEVAKEALDVLKAIKGQFDAGAQQVYAGALLFEDESTLQDHVNSVVQALEQNLRFTI